VLGTVILPLFSGKNKKENQLSLVQIQDGSLWVARCFGGEKRRLFSKKMKELVKAADLGTDGHVPEKEGRLAFLSWRRRTQQHWGGQSRRGWREKKW